MDTPFAVAKWIWSPGARRNHYVVFAHGVELPPWLTGLRVRISASYHYELFINGAFISRGPVHGDPKWCQYDDFAYDCSGDAGTLQIAIVVHHTSGTDVHCLVDAPGGVIAEFCGKDFAFGTDESWRRLDMDMWCEEVPARGWALGYCEDYDATGEPVGWTQMMFPQEVTKDWRPVVVVEDAEVIWSGYGKRMTPFLKRRFVTPRTLRACRAASVGTNDVRDVSQFCDEEPLTTVQETAAFDLATLNDLLGRANAFTFDLGREHIGFYTFDITAPADVVFEVSGAELLRDGRPWIFRKGTCYSVRYRTRTGRQTFTSFSWNGFRYLHVVIRGDTHGIRFNRVGCLERKAPLSYQANFHTSDRTLERIFNLCRHTLEATPQEHLIDCPTREQTQYWGDGVFIAQSLWKGFRERSYLEYYLDGFLHVPFRDDGQISAAYPGSCPPLLDYSLIPLIGQQFHWQNAGEFYKPEPTVEKALRLKKWYDRHTRADGLVRFDFQTYLKQRLINFIDHPGLGWHNFPHPGIDRNGVSCPLNIFFLGFLHILTEMVKSVRRPEADELSRQADRLGSAIRSRFFDGKVFHDATKNGVLSEGTSWQTNGLAVYFGLVRGDEARTVMQTMLDGYNRLCRCSPYFHFYFLPALRKAGLEAEAIDLIRKEWRPMLDADATTTWEGFLGDEKDSLCHPWSTAPFLFLLEA